MELCPAYLFEIQSKGQIFKINQWTITHRATSLFDPQVGVALTRKPGLQYAFDK